MRGRCDVEVLKPLAAESAGGDLGYWEADLPDLLAVRCVSADAPAPPERDPQKPLRVDTHSVGRHEWLPPGRPFDERASIREVALGGIHVEGFDAEGQGVDEVHRRAVRAPVEPVREREPAEHSGDPPPGIESIQGATPGVPHGPVGHVTCPEASFRVALSVIHTGRGVRSIDWRQHLDGAGVRVDDSKAIPHRRYESAMASWGNGGHGLLNERRAVFTGPRVVSMQQTARNVDPVEDFLRGMPGGPLTNRRYRAGDNFEFRRPTPSFNAWAILIGNPASEAAGILSQRPPSSSASR